MILLAINILLSLVNLIVNSIVAFRSKRPCKRSAKYDLHMELQRTAPQGTEPQEVVLQDMDSQEVDPQGTEPQEVVLQDMGPQEAVPEVIKFII